MQTGNDKYYPCREFKSWAFLQQSTSEVVQGPCVVHSAWGWREIKEDFVKICSRFDFSHLCPAKTFISRESEATHLSKHWVICVYYILGSSIVIKLIWQRTVKDAFNVFCYEETDQQCFHMEEEQNKKVFEELLPVATATKCWLSSGFDSSWKSLHSDSVMPV